MIPDTHLKPAGYLTLLFVFIISLALIGCGGATETVTVTQPPAGQGTTSTSPGTTQTTATTAYLALGASLKLEPLLKKEIGPQVPYSIAINTPVLVGSDDPRVKSFNDFVTTLIELQVNDFKKQASDYSDPQASTDSSLEIDYTLKSPPGEIISLEITSDIYYAGAAHPGLEIDTFNFDLASGKTLKLSQLFAPGALYLNTLATLCSQELTRRGELTFPEGAEPTEENYRAWALTSGGLEITFAEYQVAPYSEGPQTVVVPYSALQTILDPKGPVSRLSQ